MSQIPSAAPAVSKTDLFRFLWIRRQQGNLESFQFLVKRYGNLFKAVTKSQVFFVVVDPQDLRRVLVTNSRNYSKAALHNRLSDILGNGLFTSDGAFWKRQRALVQPAYFPNQLKNYGPAVEGRVQELRNRLQSSAGTFQDIYPEMIRFTLDVVMETILGSEAKRFHQQVHDAISVIFEDIESQSFSQRILDLAPAMLTPLIKACFGGGSNRYQRAKEDLNRILYTIVSERRQSVEKDESKPARDVLSLLIKARDENREGMSDEQLRDELAIAFFAGHETSAVALTWTFVLLAQNPAAGELLFQELDRELKGVAPQLDQVESLPYTKAVIMEALRLYPPIWRLVRTAESDDTLSGHAIPKGATLVLLPYITQRSEQFWSKPEEFDPSRFLNPGEEKREMLRYLPFGAGPRVCIGQNFALNEMILALATVWQSLRFELHPRTRFQVDARMSLRPKHPIVMQVQKR